MSLETQCFTFQSQYLDSIGDILSLSSTNGPEDLRILDRRIHCRNIRLNSNGTEGTKIQTELILAFRYVLGNRSKLRI